MGIRTIVLFQFAMQNGGSMGVRLALWNENELPIVFRLRAGGFFVLRSARKIGGGREEVWVVH